MTEHGTNAKGKAFDAYVTTHVGNVPESESAPLHARAQADILAADLKAQEAKGKVAGKEAKARLDILRSDLAKAQLIRDSGSTEYPGISAVIDAITVREAKAAAEVKAIDANLAATRKTATAAAAEADRLEAGS